MTNTSNYADIIDTRNVLTRIEELEYDVHSSYVDGEHTWESDDPDVIELRQLRDLIEEVRTYSGDKPKDGVTLIRESYFTEYAQDYFDETRDHDAPASQWPYNHIDWDEAADELRVDYTEVDYDGVSYLFR